jgi:hypothetical protein
MLSLFFSVEALSSARLGLRSIVPPTSDALEHERAIINARICNFDFNSSLPYAVFQAKGWSAMKFPEMVSLCEVLAKEGRVTMDCEAKRRKPILFKWMSDN